MDIIVTLSLWYFIWVNIGLPIPISMSWFWWWIFNPEHVYDFYEQEDIKLIKIERNQKEFAKRFLVLVCNYSVILHNVLPNNTHTFNIKYQKM